MQHSFPSSIYFYYSPRLYMSYTISSLLAIIIKHAANNVCVYSHSIQRYTVQHAGQQHTAILHRNMDESAIQLLEQSKKKKLYSIQPTSNRKRKQTAAAAARNINKESNVGRCAAAADPSSFSVVCSRAKQTSPAAQQGPEECWPV